MKKKVLMLTMALLTLFMIIISPAMAITKAPYWEHVEGGVAGPASKQKMANGILHLWDLPWSGDYVGTLGTGRMDVNFENIMVNMETGEGTCLATWLITIGGNTLAGSANGRIIGGLAGISEGVFRGTHGTGTFEGIVKMGTYSVDLATGVLDAEGVIIYR